MSDSVKVAFITGGNRGLGFETARILGKQGITVVIGSRDLAQGEAAAKKLRGEGARAVEAVRFDVDKPADHKEIYDYLARKYGKLDILINNAGIFDEGLERPASGAGFNSTSRLSQEKLRQTFETNFFQPIALTQTLLPLIRKSAGGADCQPFEFAGVSDRALESCVADLRPEGVRIRRVEDGDQRVYGAPGAGIARDTDQSEFGASGLGENGDGRADGADGIERRRKDQRATGDVAGGWADRRIFPFGRGGALVILALVSASGEERSGCAGLFRLVIVAGAGRLVRARGLNFLI